MNDMTSWKEADMNRISENGLLPGTIAPPSDRPVRIYSDGIWDLFHFGHARALEQAKKIFPNVYLIVGVCGDQITFEKKGRTVMNEQERVMSAMHCKWVDQVIPNAPWVITQEFLDQHQIDYVAHDDIPYRSAEMDDVYAFVKKQGRFLPTRRTEGISTTDLITRIVKDYDTYVRRNLERGIPITEMNVSTFKATELRIKDNLSKITGSVSKTVHDSSIRLNHEWQHTKEHMPQGIRSNVEKIESTVSDILEYTSHSILSMTGMSPPRKERSESPSLPQQELNGQ